MNKLAIRQVEAIEKISVDTIKNREINNDSVKMKKV